MLRLLIDDVTLIKGKQIQAQVRLKDGSTRTSNIAKPISAVRFLTKSSILAITIHPPIVNFQKKMSTFGLNIDYINSRSC